MQTGSSSTSTVRVRGSVRVTVFCLCHKHNDADVTLLSSRRVCWIWWESAHSRERWKRKSYQHPEGAVWLQDCGDDWRWSHWSGGLPSCCKCFHPTITDVCMYDRSSMHFLTKLWHQYSIIFSPLQSAFIGFGGNVTRQQVKERSVWYVTSFGELIEELEKI